MTLQCIQWCCFLIAVAFYDVKVYIIHTFDTYVHCTYTHTHTHPFNGPLSGTTRVSRYQKGKTNLDFSEARDSEWQRLQLGHASLHLAADRQQCQYPTAQVFYRPDALPVAQPTVSKHWRDVHTYIQTYIVAEIVRTNLGHSHVVL